MNQNSISRYETEERQADYETFIAFADYFNVFIDYLLVKTDNPYLALKCVENIKRTNCYLVDKSSFFWWRWRELNPLPTRVGEAFYKFSFSLGTALGHTKNRAFLSRVY